MFSKGKQKSNITTDKKSISKSGATPASKPGTKLSKVALKNTTCAPMASASASPKAKKTENVSKKIPKGRTVQTRDEYLQGGYPKTGYENKGNYRKAVVIDTNELNELALVTLQKSGKGKPVANYDNVAKYKPFTVTKDNQNKPIKISNTFISNQPKDDVPLTSVQLIYDDCNRYENNRIKINNLKSRHKSSNK